jgi:hypothetical protein
MVIETDQRPWYIVTRQPNRLKYSLSNAAPDTPVERLAYMQVQRYFVERALKDAKQQGGLASPHRAGDDGNALSYVRLGHLRA